MSESFSSLLKTGGGKQGGRLTKGALFDRLTLTTLSLETLKVLVTLRHGMKKSFPNPLPVTVIGPHW